VSPCTEGIQLANREEYRQLLLRSTFVVTPMGSMPTSFRLFECLQVGSMQYAHIIPAIRVSAPLIYHPSYIAPPDGRFANLPL
jgi:hypothetical protein